MNNSKAPKRTITSIHRKLNILQQQFPDSIEGLDECQLMNPNCPKTVTVNAEILTKQFVIDEENNIGWTLSQKDLMLFFLKKYNLFANQPTPCNQEEHPTLAFSFQNGSILKKVYLEEVNSEEYLEKFFIIEKLVATCFLEKPEWFTGLKKKHFQQNVNPPRKITIEKNSISDVCKLVTKIENPTEETISSDTQKIQRAMSLFFKARFNLVNNTKMNRKYLTYTQNFPKKKSKQNISRKRSRTSTKTKTQNKKQTTKTKIRAKTTTQAPNKTQTKTRTIRRTRNQIKKNNKRSQSIASNQQNNFPSSGALGASKSITKSRRITRSRSKLNNRLELEDNKCTVCTLKPTTNNTKNNLQPHSNLQPIKDIKKNQKKFEFNNEQFMNFSNGDTLVKLQCFERNNPIKVNFTDNTTIPSSNDQIEAYETIIKEDLQMLKQLLKLKNLIDH
ncbi:hypothetical protein M0812_15862 [Anaeramoeba flamelloides]|uniref:Uncharacterized protein n=1 Tax=Anaeramoeba flamelloides TaxID=1746091 RepID=A0AAV7ZGH9_9EUKA|nr:hypothetical protein M0812_15862 [Anaeramoeba flamelloides]